MAVKNKYNFYYEYDSTARKLQRGYEEQKGYEEQNDVKPNLKKKSKIIPFILGIFTMTLILTCRYTLINEKNMQSIGLKSELEKAETALFSAQVSVEQMTDLNKIEAYAKQQLGMQKPTKNQIVYVDTSENIGTVELAKNQDWFSSVKLDVMNFFKNIF